MRFYRKMYSFFCKFSPQKIKISRENRKMTSFKYQQNKLWNLQNKQYEIFILVVSTGTQKKDIHTLIFVKPIDSWLQSESKSFKYKYV